MWTLRNKTPYAAERSWVRDKAGEHLWIVAVKATFQILPDGRLKLADEQRPPLLAPEYFGEPGASSLRYEADLGLPKPTTDIIVNAHAHAPGSRPAPSVSVSLRVDDIRKSLLVHGERVYYQGATGLTTSNPRPFLSQPIRYEAAFGGADLSDPDPRNHRMDMRNPIGRGFARDRAELADRPAHTIEYPGTDPAAPGPAGFGALASYWSPRLELGGTYDARWEQTKKPFLPDDYDAGATLCAPADQRPQRHLYGGERFELVHLTPEGAMRFDLPKIYLTFSTSFGRRREEHRSRLATVIVELEDRCLMLVWQTALRVSPRDADYLDATVIEEKPYLQ